MNNNFNWSEYFMTQAITVSLKSKDPSTKVGCIIVDPIDNKQISMGYNGFPKGIDESKLTWNKDVSHGIENTKYPYVVHAEANALLNAVRDVKGADVYVTLQPCSECSKLLISAQIGRVFYLKEKHCKMAQNLLELANIPSNKYILSEQKINKVIETFIKVRDCD